MSLGAHQSENTGGICKVLIFRTIDLPFIVINEIDDDTVEFTRDDAYMFEVTPETGQYREPGTINANGKSYAFTVNFNVAKDRKVQRQFDRKYANVALQALVKNQNGDWKYTKNLRLNSNLNGGANAANLNGYAYSLVGNSADPSQFAIIQELAIVIRTEWDESVDGAFAATITASQTAKWLFENGTEVFGNAISASSTGLDGTVQTVRLILSDFDTLTGLSIPNAKLVGVLDLSLVQLTTGVNLGSNENLNSLIFSPFDNIGSLTVNNTGLASLDLSNYVLTGTFNAFNCDNLTSITHSNKPGIPSLLQGLYRIFGSEVSTIDFGNFVFDTDIDGIQLQNNNMATAELDQILLSIDTLALAGNAVIRIGGTNASPTGGMANVNVVSLINKGYSFIF